MTEGVLLDVRDLTKRFGGLLLAAALKGWVVGLVLRVMVGRGGMR